jgi:hypothetical protein
MKSANRKVLMTLLGVMLAAPFLVIAAVVGIQAAALAGNVRVDVFCVGLAIASVAIKIVDGHLAQNRIQVTELFRTNGNTDPKSSMISSGY